MKSILCFSDPHFPWSDARVFTALWRRLRSGPEPSHVICLGDLYDLLSFGRFARSLDVCTPAEELELGRRAARECWRRINILAPEAVKIQIRGNHDQRIVDRALAKAPEYISLIDTDSLWQFDGVTTLSSDRDHYEYQGIVFTHGFKTRPGDMVRYLLKSCCIGHSHRGGVTPLRLGDQTIFECNAGHCCDRTAAPFGYTKMRQFSTWTPGYAEWNQINGQWQPRFIAA